MSLVDLLWWQAQLEGDRATIPIWNLKFFLAEAQLQLRSGKATGLQLQFGNLRFFASRPRCNCDLGTCVFSLVAEPAGRPFNLFGKTI